MDDLVLPRLHVAITISGLTVKPETITERTGIAAAQMWKVGDIVGRSALRRKENGWSLALAEVEAADFEPLVQQLLGRLEAGRAAWNELITGDAHVELSCVAYVQERAPSICFGLETLRRITALGAGIDVDVVLC